MSRQRFLDAATLLMVLCAIVLTGFVARREFFPPQSLLARSGSPVLQEDWQTYGTGNALGPTRGNVTIVEFADFECVSCRRLGRYVDSLRVLDKSVRILYRHSPRPGREFAFAAALASECAAEQDRFEEMHSMLQEHPDSMGLQPWWWFAQIAGVTDKERFDTCITGEWARMRVAADTAEAQRLGMQAIPTLLVNRWRFDGLPPFDTLLAYVDLAMTDSVR